MAKTLLRFSGCLMAALIVVSCIRSQDYSLSALKESDGEVTLFMDGFSASVNETRSIVLGDFLKPSGILGQNEDGTYFLQTGGVIVESDVISEVTAVNLPPVRIFLQIPEEIHEKSCIFLHSFKAAFEIDNDAPFAVKLTATAVARRKGCEDVSFPIVCAGDAHKKVETILDEESAAGITEAVNMGPEEIEFRDIRVSIVSENPTGSGRVKVSYLFNAPLILDEGSWISLSKTIGNNVRIAGVNKSRAVIGATANSTVQMAVEADISLYINGSLVELPLPVEIAPCIGGVEPGTDFTIDIEERYWEKDLVIGDINVDALVYADRDGVEVNAKQGLSITMTSLSFPEGLTIGGAKR